VSRGSYSTPLTSSTPSASAPTGLEPRTHQWFEYGVKHTSTIDPSAFDLPRLAAALADSWAEVLGEQGGPDSSLGAGIRSFLVHVGAQTHAVDSLDEFGPGDLRRRHLDAWERDLAMAHREARTDTNYRKAVYVFALLERMEADAPGLLDRSVKRRLESETRLNHHRNGGVPAFTDDEIRAMRGRAHRLVFSHLRSGSTSPTWQVLVAVHLLLSLGTGEPPEVLRGVNIDDISATTTSEHDEATAGMTPSRRLAWLAERDLVDTYAVSYTKNRAHTTFEEVYTRRQRAAHSALTAAIRLTAALRERSRIPAVWLIAQGDGTVVEVPWNSDQFRLRTWIADSLTGSNPLRVNEPLIWARVRKVAIPREAMANPGVYLARGRRHTSQTFFGHYTNSEVLMEHAGSLLVEAVTDMFEQAVYGPSIVTIEAEELLAQGVEAPGLDRETAAALLRGDLDGPQSGCRDPEDSPYADPGVTCQLSMTGTCFGCGNALITRHHLPAALLIAELAHPDRAADPAVWLENWKFIYESITQVILPAFPQQEIDRARQQMDQVPVDLGTMNDLRGFDA
jgi:hypothetical protein